MDERFEMFFNDVDICKRIIDGGQRICLITSAVVVHKHGESINKDKVRMIKAWNNDCLEYFKKYHPSALLLLWLRINLKISEIFRILYFKIKK
jgi:GT2 family glycosyltransferase